MRKGRPLKKYEDLKKRIKYLEKEYGFGVKKKHGEST